MNVNYRLGLLALLALAGLAPPTHAGQLDQFVPIDSTFIFKVNVRQLLDSPLAKDYWAPGLRWQYNQAKHNDKGEMGAFFKDVHFDPFKDLDRVLFTSTGEKAARSGLAVLRGRFDPGKIRAKVEKLIKSQPDSFKIIEASGGKGGDYRIYQAYPGSLGAIYVALPDATTLFVSDDKAVVLDALKKFGSHGKADLKNKDLQGVLEALDDKQVMGVASVGNWLDQFVSPTVHHPASPRVSQQMDSLLERFVAPTVLDQLHKSIQNVAAFSGGLTLGKDIKLEVALTANTVDEAKSTYAVANTGVRLAVIAMTLKQNQDNPLDELFFDLVTSIKVRRKDRTVFYKGRLNVEEAETALQNAGVDIKTLKEAFKKPFEK